ncbi:S-layer homology domain-containing protein [Veillonella intestinalis]|uniref:S-layer homology domain-containing protein n=1 Tax=Veillonella intestinalis TaxID=2941341 RepID=UPI00203CCD1D|nr:S-layer homology domain-containing protein [Veillonella intestinalis]
MSKFFQAKPAALLCALMLTNTTVWANIVTDTDIDATEASYGPVRVVKEASNETTFSPLTLDYYTKSNTVQALGKATKAQQESAVETTDINNTNNTNNTNNKDTKNKVTAKETGSIQLLQDFTPSTVTPNTDSPIFTGTAQPSVFQEARKYTFVDVPADYWAATSIAVMTNQQLISGYSDNTFRPDKPITREEVASLFSNLISDESPVMLASSFNDITSDRWSANAIERVAQLNIISGYGDKTYRPERFMSRQEFAVVADNYIHYLGYTTEDPTALDSIHYSDQKFIAPWAQDAVRELASLGFLHYQSRLLFGPEKYITRAEATEIMYRVTNSSSAVALREKILHQQIENKMLTLVERTFGKEYVFRTHGAMFWQNNKLIATLKSENDAKKLGAALAFTKDKTLVNNVQVTVGSLTEIELGKLQTEVAYFYNQQEPTGSIITITPNKNASGLVLTVDELKADTIKAFAKKFGNKVEISLPANNG